MITDPDRTLRIEVIGGANGGLVHLQHLDRAARRGNRPIHRDLPRRLQRHRLPRVHHDACTLPHLQLRTDQLIQKSI